MADYKPDGDERREYEIYVEGDRQTDSPYYNDEQMSQPAAKVQAPVSEPVRPDGGHKKHNVWIWVVTAIVIAIVAAVVIWLLTKPASEESTGPIERENTEQSVQDLTSAKKEPERPKARLSYGEWDGELRFNQPHGHGTLTFTTQRLVSQFDPGHNVAKPGDYIIGEYDNGQLVEGKLYHTNGKTVTIVTTGNPTAVHR